MGSKCSGLTFSLAAAAALLCGAAVSQAQEETKPPVIHPEQPAKPAVSPTKPATSPAHPAAGTPAPRTAAPAAKTPTAPAKSTAPAKPAAATSAAPSGAKAAAAPAAKSAAASQPATAAGGQPAKIRICDPDNAGSCWTYTRNGDHYDGVGERGGNRTMTLESFSAGSVVMHVTQAGKPGWSSTNSGKMTGNGIELGDWSDNSGRKGRITASWDAPRAAGGHTNVETAEGMENRAAAGARSRATAEPAAQPPK